jgi:hypothetical protein
MRLTWKDGLATVFVGLAVVLFVVWSAGAAVSGISGRGLVVAILLLGIAGCYTARSQFETFYGVNGTTRATLAYVVLVSVVGALATVAGIVAVIGGGTVAVTTLLLAMVVMWILATVRHQRRASADHSAATGAATASRTRKIGAAG